MNTNIKNIILLIIRVVAGGLLAWAGYMKLSNMDATITALGGMTGLSAGYIWAVALGELAAGLGIVFGVWTRLAAAGAAIIMIGAVYYTKGQDMKAIEILVA
ncbi:DoxX family membrane protein, partial [Candidatus Parcubacteria bacterium]|nr:DoxX family membrane protein [Candidatus Parcubacteria bacterium]